MSGAAAAELSKIRTLPATWVAVAVAVAAGTVLGVLAADGGVRVGSPAGPVGIGRLGTVMLAPAYVFVAVAVFAAGSEYRGGQLRVSLLAVPSRARLFAAKLTVTTAVSVPGAVLVILPGHLARGAAVAGLAPLVTAYLLLALVGFGLAVLARTVVTPLALLFGVAVLVGPALRGVVPQVVRHLPHDAALSLAGMADDPAALTRPGGFVVLLAWAAVSLAAAAAAFTRRDA